MLSSEVTGVGVDATGVCSMSSGVFMEETVGAEAITNCQIPMLAAISSKTRTAHNILFELF
jgi:hypothetical protein